MVGGIMKTRFRCPACGRRFKAVLSTSGLRTLPACRCGTSVSEEDVAPRRRPLRALWGLVTWPARKAWRVAAWPVRRVRVWRSRRSAKDYIAKFGSLGGLVTPEQRKRNEESLAKIAPPVKKGVPKGGGASLIYERNLQEIENAAKALGCKMARYCDSLETFKENRTDIFWRSGFYAVKAEVGNEVLIQEGAGKAIARDLTKQICAKTLGSRRGRGGHGGNN